jgi:hypothetical protein
MDLFLSWSGKRSKAVAEALKLWLRQVIQAVEPWISSDIDKGARWSDEVATRLERSKVGIICLTQDNLASPWILFEAGALSKTKDAYVCTFLLDLSPDDVAQPLSQFQLTTADKEDCRKLLGIINEAVRKAGERHLSDQVLDGVFDTNWPKLEAVLTNLPPATPRSAPEMSDVPAELTQSLLARRDSIGHRQEDLLRVLFHYIRQPDDSIAQSAILDEIRKKHPNVTESELYYRLEHLRLLGFITKERLPQSPSHHYRLSAAYRRARG